MFANISLLNNLLSGWYSVYGVWRIWGLWRLGSGKGWGEVGWVTVKKLFIKRAVTHWWNQALCLRLGFLLTGYCPTLEGNITPSPYLPAFFPSPSLLPSFPGPEEVVFCHIYTFSGIEKTGSQTREHVSSLKAWIYLFASRDSTPDIVERFCHISICCLYTDDLLFTGNASTKG